MARTVSVVLQAKVAGFVAGFRTAQRAAADLNTQLRAAAARGDLDEIAQGAGVAGAALAAFAGLAIKRFADFDAAMSNVKAATHESATNMEALRQAALQAGQDTKFSAVEAARGITELAKAGVATRDILAGGLKGALDLASAGAIDVGAAAEFAATAMTQFRLAGNDVPHVADLLAAAAGKAQGEVSDVAQALQQAGLVAAQFGISIEETVGTLGAFASAGLLGSDAGTSLKTMLLRLAAPSAEAAAKMKALGIAAYDAEGRFVGLQAFAGQLATSLSGLTQKERDAALSIIFGSDAIRAANVLYQQGAQGIEKWTNKVDDAGYAAETARLKTDNLRGDIERLGGAFDTALIKSGSASNDALRALTQTATALVDQFGRLPGAVQGTATVVTLLAGGALLAAAAFGTLAPRIQQARAELEAIGPAGQRANAMLGTLGRVGAVAAVASLALLGLGAALRKMLEPTKEHYDANKMADAIEAIGRAGSSEIWRVSKANLDGIDDALKRITDPTGWQKFSHGFDEAIQFITGDEGLGKLPEARKQLESLDQALAQMVRSGNAREAAAGLLEISRTFGINMRDLAKFLPQYRQALDEAAKASGGAAGATDQLTGATDDAKAAFLAAKEAANEYIKQIRGMSDPLIDLQEAQDEMTVQLKELRESIRENGRAFTGNSDAALANREALRNAVTSVLDYGEALAANGATHDQLSEKMGAARQQLVTVLTQMIGNRGEAERLTAAIFGVPDDHSTEFVTNADGTKTKVDSLGRAINNLPQRKTIDVFLKYHYGGEGTPPPGTSSGTPKLPAPFDRRWGGADYHMARGGTVAAHFASAPTILYGERQTGGEAFVPRLGDAARSRRILDVAAGWYGGHFAPGPRGGDGAAASNITVNVYPQPGQSESEITAMVKRELAWQMGR